MIFNNKQIVIQVTIASLFLFSFLISVNTHSTFWIALTFFFVSAFIISKLSFKRNDPLPKMLGIVILSVFVIRIFYAYNTYSTILSPFPDSFNYIDRLDMLIATEKLDFQMMEMISGTSQFFFYYIMYIIYKIFNNYFAINLINILFYSISMGLLYRILIKDFSKRIAYVTTILSIFSTVFMLFTSNILKDSTVLFLAMLVLYVYKYGGKKLIPLLFILVLCLILTRIYAGFSITAAILVDVTVSKNLFKTNKSKFIGGMILVSAFIFAFNNSYFSRYIAQGEDFLFDYSSKSLVTSTISALFNMFFAPYPWGIFSGVHTTYTILQLDTSIVLIFSFTLIMFLYKFFKYSTLRVKTYMYITIIFFHALTLGLAYDGGIRQKIAAYSFMILLMVIGLFYKKDPTNKKAFISKETPTD